jgi:uncharacterized protein (DUF2147 family)
MNKLISFTLVTALASLSLSAFANDGVLGLWKNIDDKTGKPRALIRISENNGGLQGKIEKVFPAPGEEQNPKCDKCEGAQKDQPIIGMTILTGFKKEAEGKYVEGKILDPDNGKVYSSKLTLVDGKLNVRGYIGFSLLGRSQVWVREQ